MNSIHGGGNMKKIEELNNLAYWRVGDEQTIKVLRCGCNCSGGEGGGED